MLKAGGLAHVHEQLSGGGFSNGDGTRKRTGKSHTRKKKKQKSEEGAEGKAAAAGDASQHNKDAKLIANADGSESKSSSTSSSSSRGARKFTLSIAVPGSIVENAPTRELQTYLVGQLARAAAIYEVDEIVVYDDKMGGESKQGGLRGESSGRKQWNSSMFMARVLQFMETPQYLRKALFPMHSDLRFAGLLNPLDSPHHMRAEEDTPFREGVVVDKPVKEGAGSLVNVGKRKEARIDRHLKPGVRVTVKLDPKNDGKRNLAGKAVAPSAPREELGIYWGYQTRLASGIGQVFSESPFKKGYDLTIGTSERGTTSVDDADFQLAPFRHCIIVFGGVQGIEESLDNDEAMSLPGNQASCLFDRWVNTCPSQGSRTIRTEEAVLLTLARTRKNVLDNVWPD